MAATAQTLENGAAAANYPALSNRDVLLCLVGYYASLTGMTAKQAMVGAAAASYSALSAFDLNKCILEVLS